MVLACVAMPLTSCEDEPQNEAQEQHDPISDEDQTTIAGYDALEYLQSCIVVVDKNGVVTDKVLNEMTYEDLVATIEKAKASNSDELDLDALRIGNKVGNLCPTMDLEYIDFKDDTE